MIPDLEKLLDAIANAQMPDGYAANWCGPVRVKIDELRQVLRTEARRMIKENETA
jgi:hypothetical protein